MPSVPSSDRTPLVAVLERDIASDNLRLQYNSLRDRARSRKDERQRAWIAPVHSPKLAVNQYDVIGASRAARPLRHGDRRKLIPLLIVARSNRRPNTAAGNDFSAELQSPRDSRATTADACASAFPAGPTACAS